MPLSDSEKTMRKTVMVDFDGTICPVDFPHMPAPYKQARNMLCLLHEAGFYVVIWTVRHANYWQYAASTKQDIKYATIPNYEKIRRMANYMKRFQLPFDDISLIDKPYALAYIDDRAYQARGNNLVAIARKIIVAHGD